MTATTSPTAHVPGPYDYAWDRNGCDDYWYIFPKNDPKHELAQIVFWDCEPEWMERTRVQARLFAAAPELLDMVKRLLELVDHLPSAFLELPLLNAIFDGYALVDRTEGRK